MESLAAVLPELKAGGELPWNLKDAYLHIAIDPSDKKWLGFSIDEQTYRFKSLPFGLSTAPRTFTRIVKVVAEHFRRKGVSVFVYLDDWLLTAPSAGVLRRNILITKRLVHSASRLQGRKGFPDSREGPGRHRMRQAHHERTSSSGPSLDASAGVYSKPHSNPSSVPSTHEDHPASRSLQVQKLQAPIVPQDSSDRVKKAVSWWTQPANIQPGKRFLTTDGEPTGRTFISQAPGHHLWPSTTSISWSCGPFTWLYAVFASISAPIRLGEM